MRSLYIIFMPNANCTLRTSLKENNASFKFFFKIESKKLLICMYYSK